ncbi:MAG: S-adenosylmethionine decarboxylase [Clostridia bacterium]|nr:S-adenosylmethionine decarboxylase [Clostridia bacterium]
MYNYYDWIKYEDEKEFVKKCEKMLVQSGFKILKKTEHYFEPIGYTGLFLLAESHFAIHSFPEEEKIYIELSSCVKEFYDNFIVNIKEYRKYNS